MNVSLEAGYYYPLTAIKEARPSVLYPREENFTGNWDKSGSTLFFWSLLEEARFLIPYFVSVNPQT